MTTGHKTIKREFDEDEIQHARHTTTASRARTPTLLPLSVLLLCCVDGQMKKRNEQAPPFSLLFSLVDVRSVIYPYKHKHGMNFIIIHASKLEL